MSSICVMKRRSGTEHIIPVWNLGGFIETERVKNSASPDKIDALEAILTVDSI